MKNYLHLFKQVFLAICLFMIIAFSPLNISAQPSDLPWNPDPSCNSIMTTGIAAITCGTAVNISEEDQYTFGLVDLNGALPPLGRIDVTNQQDMYHHPAWHVDSIGNVFGIALDDCGNIFLGASANYSSSFINSSAIIRYGEIGGGADDIEAAGTVYKIDGLTGAPSVFSVLPQQVFQVENVSCLPFDIPMVRNTGPGLGNLVFHSTTRQFYVSNFEDGRIYRLNEDGVILDSFDPFSNDDGAVGIPDLSELTYGLAIPDDGNQLFFGTIKILNSPNDLALPPIYSIELNPDGSFVGTVNNTSLPVGATWNNYEGPELFHISAQKEGGIFSLDYEDATYFCSDLTFTPSGDLLAGFRASCPGTSIFNSVNHGGEIVLIENIGGLYNNVEGFIYTGFSTLSGFGGEAYGGVSVFENPTGTTEFVASSGDILNEFGPHGLCIQEEGSFGSLIAPATPAGVISYLTGANAFTELKGAGGDVEVFKQCGCILTCPSDIMASTDFSVVCSNSSIDLTYTVVDGNSPLEIVWTNENNEVINPEGIVLENQDCAPLIYTFTVTATCEEDMSVVLSDEVEITVYTDDISPFITTVEELCFVDVVIAPECMGFLTLVDQIPIINPGDSGTVSIDVSSNDMTACALATVDLSFNCPTCSINNVTVTNQECVDSTFLVELDLEVISDGDSLRVIDQNGNDLGTFSYDELPVLVGPFFGDSTITYGLNIQDTGDPTCTAIVEIQHQDCLNLCGRFEIPNAFTPNYDNINDNFTIVAYGPAEVIEFKIYNRWGNLVYDNIEPWDGKYNGESSTADVFIYDITVDTKCGIERKIGDVTLIR